MLMQTPGFAGFTQLVLNAMKADLKWPRPITRYANYNQISNSKLSSLRSLYSVNKNSTTVWCSSNAMNLHWQILDLNQPSGLAQR
jgi:hypothetical protein